MDISFITKNGTTTDYLKIEDFFQGNRFLAFDEFCSKFEIKTTVYATRSPKNGSIFLKCP